MEQIKQTETVDLTDKKDGINELIRYEKKNLLINRIKLGLIATAAAVIILIAVMLSVNIGKITHKIEEVSAVMTDAGESINTVANNLKKIDFEELGASVQAFTTVGTETIEQIKNATEGLDTMLSDVNEAVKKLGNVDIDELNNGIKTLNDVLQPLADFFSVFKQ